MGSRPRILVVYKKSAFQLYALERKDPKVRALVKKRARTARLLEASHDAHETALATVVAACRRTGADVREVYRAHVRGTDHADLVVTVGGDGTILDASHQVGRVPVLGVNSNPARSVGFLTAATARTFSGVLDQWMSGSLQPRRLLRLDVLINGRSVGVPVLNDLLFCHANPAATTRYRVFAGGHTEEQKSSGAWVCTPTGSTAAMQSAGGERQDWTDRRFQWRIREPFAPPGHVVRMRGGFVPSRGLLKFGCQMRDGAVFVDGSHVRFSVGMGDTIVVRAWKDDLHLVRPDR